MKESARKKKKKKKIVFDYVINIRPWLNQLNTHGDSQVLQKTDRKENNSFKFSWKETELSIHILAQYLAVLRYWFWHQPRATAV